MYQDILKPQISENPIAGQEFDDLILQHLGGRDLCRSYMLQMTLGAAL